MITELCFSRCFCEARNPARHIFPSSESFDRQITRATDLHHCNFIGSRTHPIGTTSVEIRSGIGSGLPDPEFFAGAGCTNEQYSRFFCFISWIFEGFIARNEHGYIVRFPPLACMDRPDIGPGRPKSSLQRSIGGFDRLKRALSPSQIHRTILVAACPQETLPGFLRAVVRNRGCLHASRPQGVEDIFGDCGVVLSPRQIASQAGRCRPKPESRRPCGLLQNCEWLNASARDLKAQVSWLAQSRVRVVVRSDRSDRHCSIILSRVWVNSPSGASIPRGLSRAHYRRSA